MLLHFINSKDLMKLEKGFIKDDSISLEAFLRVDPPKHLSESDSNDDVVQD